MTPEPSIGPTIRPESVNVLSFFAMIYPYM